MDDDPSVVSIADSHITESTTELQSEEIVHELPEEMKPIHIQNASSDHQILVHQQHIVGRTDSIEEMVVSTQPDTEIEEVRFTDLETGTVVGPRPPCAICNDHGSGYHYSVYSCEGCKGFFKRTVQKNLAYSCKENQNCVINKYSRNSCQFCRYKKCLEVGMKREAVREDRTPGGKHRHKRFLEDGTPATETSTQPAGQIQQLVLTEEPLDEDLLRQVLDAKPDIMPQADEDFDLDSITADQLMQFGYMELRYIIEWARKVPGFQDLALEDQMQLLKASFMELNVLRLAYRSLETKDQVRFAQNIVLSQEKVSNIGFGSDLVIYTLDFVSRLKDIAMDMTEFSILNAIVLTYPDATGLKDKEPVYRLQCKMLDLLRRYSLNTYPWQPRRYGKILLRLPALRIVSAKAAERFLSMTLDGSVRMNALVLEIMS